MKCNRTLTTLSLLTLAAGIAIAEPDLIVSDITSATTFGSVDDKIAYSFGTTICNIGDTETAWIDGTNQNPLISQTLYRLADGQIHQLGIGFAHYATPPLSGNACGLGCTPAGFNALGAGCSTTSSSAIHGAQGSLGPRTEINPFSGDYPYPFTSIGQTGDAIYKRLQVELADISDPNALYFVETQIITSAESTPETRANNVSYRQVTFAPGSANATVVGPTYTEQPAIFAWRDHGNGIGMPNMDVMIIQQTIPGDGIIHAGSLVTDLGDGTYRYDYAIHNQNAQNAISSLMVPGAGWFDQLTNATFHGIDYHDDVDGLIDDSDIINRTNTINTSWAQSWSPANQLQEDDNAVRWGTTYSYSFTAPNEPRSYQSVLHYAIPGVGGSPVPLVVDTVTPTQSDVCFVDLNGDGVLNFYEVSFFLSSFSAKDPSADFVPDGMFDFFDVSSFLNALAAGCP